MEQQEAEQFIGRLPWTEAKWARGTAARHFYVMEFWPEVDLRKLAEFTRLIEQHGYQARWGRYTLVYLELASWTYWWIPRCLNREHKSVETLRVPASAAEAELLEQAHRYPVPEQLTLPTKEDDR